MGRLFLATEGAGVPVASTACRQLPSNSWFWISGLVVEGVYKNQKLSSNHQSKQSNKKVPDTMRHTFGLRAHLTFSRMARTSRNAFTFPDQSLRRRRVSPGCEPFHGSVFEESDPSKMASESLRFPFNTPKTTGDLRHWAAPGPEGSNIL